MEEQKMQEAKSLTGHLAMLLTPEGEVPVRTDGTNVLEELPVPKVPLGELPKDFRPRHHDGIMSLAAFVGMILQSKRKLPALRDELIEQWGVDKATIKDLEKMGFIKCRITPILSAKTGKRVGGARVIVFHTFLGHAYLRKVKDDAVQSAGGSLESMPHSPGAGLSVPEGDGDVSGADPIGQTARGASLRSDPSDAVGQPADSAG